VCEIMFEGINRYKCNESLHMLSVSFERSNESLQWILEHVRVEITIR